VLAAKIAAPVIASLFLVDLALALVSRAAPQMNVLFIGFPLKSASVFCS
jgi:flagellar biosynthetic protein FliR